MPADNPAAYLTPEFSSPLATLMRQLAIGDYQSFQTNRAEGTAVGDMERMFGSMRERIAPSFARRGMVNSGMHNAAWGDAMTGEDRGFGQLNQGFNDQFAQLQSSRSDAENKYSLDRALREYNPAQYRANKASQIKGWA